MLYGNYFIGELTEDISFGENNLKKGEKIIVEKEGIHILPIKKVKHLSNFDPNDNTKPIDPLKDRNEFVVKKDFYQHKLDEWELNNFY